MTDYKKFTSLLDEFGVGHECHESEEGATVEVSQNTDGKKVFGYKKFYMTFDFDEEGRFSGIGLWE